MTVDVATGIARILKQEGIEWVSTFPVCRVNNALGRENIPMVMTRDDRYAVALADGGYSSSLPPSAACSPWLSTSFSQPRAGSALSRQRHSSV